jgi:hypothetical protein
VGTNRGWTEDVSARLARTLRTALSSRRVEALPPATARLARAMTRMSSDDLLALGLAPDARRCVRRGDGAYLLVKGAFREWLGGAC